MTRKMWLPIFVVLAMLFGACGININLNVSSGSGNVITQRRSVSDFDRVVLNGIGDLTITQGSAESLSIEAEDNVIPHIKTAVSGSTLTINFDNKAVIPTKPVKFNVTMTTVHGLDTRGVSNIEAEKINTDSLEVGISGTGNINLRDLTARKTTATISGAGNYTATGKVDSQKVVVSGAGNYNGEDLQSKTADITISGLGKVTIWVTDQLDVVISGTGGVDYFGSPQTTQKISGLGSLKHLGDK